MHRHVRYLCIHEVQMSPALKKNSALQCFEHDNVIKNAQWNNVQFLPRTATYICMYMQSKISIPMVSLSDESYETWLEKIAGACTSTV